MESIKDALIKANADNKRLAKALAAWHEISLLGLDDCPQEKFNEAVVLTDVALDIYRN